MTSNFCASAPKCKRARPSWRVSRQASGACAHSWIRPGQTRARSRRNTSSGCRGACGISSGRSANSARNKIATATGRNTAEHAWRRQSEPGQQAMRMRDAECAEQRKRALEYCPYTGQTHVHSARRPHHPAAARHRSPRSRARSAACGRAAGCARTPSRPAPRPAPAGCRSSAAVPPVIRPKPAPIATMATAPRNARGDTNQSITRASGTAAAVK